MMEYHRKRIVQCPVDGSDVELSVTYHDILRVKQTRPDYKIIVTYSDCPNYSNCELLDRYGRCPVRPQIPNVP